MTAYSLTNRADDAIWQEALALLGEDRLIAALDAGMEHARQRRDDHVDVYVLSPAGAESLREAGQAARVGS